MLKKTKQEEIPMEGPGVSAVIDQKLYSLADEFTDKRYEKAKLAEDMTAIETKIVERMMEIKAEVYRYADREVRIKYGKSHINIKTIKNEGVAADE